jgi:hypothetical protein
VGRFDSELFHSAVSFLSIRPRYDESAMPFPIKTCVVCGEEFELRPDKPGFANRCPECSTPEAMDSGEKHHLSADELKAEAEMNEARRRTIRDMLYRNDS